MAHALGSLAELAPGHSVRVLALRACERYRASVGGTNDDPAARRAAAAALRSIAVRASNQFSDGGSGDIWCKRVLPLAYLGRKDDDKKIAGLWLEVWEEGGAVANAGGSDGSDFGVTLEEKLLPYLVKACMAALDDVSWSRRVTACQALVDLTDMEILAPAPRKLDAQKVNGLSPTRQSLTRAHRRAQASAEVLATCTLLIGKGRLWTGKAEVVKAVAKIACKWSIVGDTTTSSTPDSTDWSIFGADNAGACTWIPIKQDDEDWDSLFLGDRWFKSNDASSLASLPEGNEAASLAATGRGDGNTVDDNEEEAEGEDSGGLDFGDEEKVVGSEQLSARTSDVSEGEDEVRRTTTTTLTVSGLCRLLLGQGLLSPSASSRDNDILLPYRAASLQALADIINSLRPLKGRTKTTSTASAHDRYLYKHIAPIILSNIQLKDASDEVSKPQPPLITARCLGCLSALIYHGLGSGKVSCDNDEEDIVSLSRIIVDFSGGKQPAWTVREAAALAAASLAARASPEKLRKHAATTALLECSTNAQKDRKFWRVRLAGLQLLLALVERAGSAPGDNVIAARSSSGVDAELQLMLEALLPEKENIAKIARTCLSDNEAQVTDVATKICGAISWWP
jgi:proteasome component ECM29